MERAYRTLRERLEEEELTDPIQAKEVLATIITWYNERRLHSALGFLPPADYYRGNPKIRHEQRRQKRGIGARKRTWS